MLTKQMKLLTNLLRDYSLEVSREIWEQFYIVLQSQFKTITGIIQGEAGPQRKQNAQQALTSLTEALHNYLTPDQQIAV